MLKLLAVVLLSAVACAQAKPDSPAADPPAKGDTAEKKAAPLVIPAGAKIPVALQHAISTKNAREGDPVYA